VEGRQFGGLAVDLADFLAPEFVGARPEPNAVPLTWCCAGSLYFVKNILTTLPPSEKKEF
jgi:hypothetical protein